MSSLAVRLINKLTVASRTRSLAAVLLCSFIYISLNYHGYSWYLFADGANDPSVCLTPAKEMDDLRALIRDTHVVLDEVGLLHFPIYGSLWGLLRNKEPLTWDNDFDFALLGSSLANANEQDIVDRFTAKGIGIHYRPWFGTYRVTRDSARGDLMIFRPSLMDSEWMVRVGYEAYVLFPNYLRFHTFPSRLIEAPYTRDVFCGMNMTIPREGIEIQKHFYPNNWWKESKPSGCR